MPPLPGYVSVVFILTTFAAVAFLLQMSRTAGLHRFPSRLIIFLLPLWIFFQAALALGGFYQNITGLPPRLITFAVLPSILLIGIYFVFFRSSFVEKLPFSLLTLVHTVRLPVELVLYWLCLGRMVPEVMTFAGWNFDIASGVFAPIVYLFAARSGRDNRKILIAFNILGLLLLVNIVSIAVLASETPLQRLAFDQPNRAVLYFPYVWLPSIVVPIVLFAHLASLWKLLVRHRTP